LEEVRNLRRKLKELFDKQRIGVLSTQKRNRPYASLVAFVVTDDLKSFVFATPRTTRKYSNIIASIRHSTYDTQILQYYSQQQSCAFDR
jgi:nitroimidazol reductase NimA-like FMN-containing flavoprotein (pyridoxamine 5'-phosphate oxidase superfamily)